MKFIDGGVGAPQGFTVSGVYAGIKKNPSKKDCALIVSDRDATAAGMFTRNLLKSPPVVWNQALCRAGSARAVFINSGVANAATGPAGHEDVRTTADYVAGKIGADPSGICLCSTGVIGVRLPMDKIRAGIDACHAALSENGSGDAATAIMTTDKVAKAKAVEVTIDGKPVRIGAIAKGAGMISPNMATMICLLTTDAGVTSNVLQDALRSCVDLSFNRIGIDNDMSTSDTVLLLANGASGVDLDANHAGWSAFYDALLGICQEMAAWLVKDGEGVTKFVTIAVDGTANDEDARTVARAIGNSMLCKTAFFGEDPNWGRFACAAGYAGVDFDPANLDIALDGVTICAGGLAADYREEDAAAVMKQPEFRIGVSVGGGPGHAEFWTSDLSHDYVSINADYRS